MCGRYVRTRDAATLAAHFGAVDSTESPLRPDYNMAPTRSAPIVLDAPTDDTSGRQVALARWGLIPSWAKDPRMGAKLINARVETVAEKPSFRSAVKRRRCLVPADGFYEWTVSDDAAKQPWYIHPPADDDMLALAGLYELWRPKDDTDGPWTRSFTVLTTTAADSLGHIHDRSPLLVPVEHWNAWLSPTNDDVAALLEPLLAAAAGDLIAEPVSPKVNSVKHNSPDLVTPIAHP